MDRQISTQVWKHSPQTIVIEYGIALTADAAERAVGCALRDF